MFIIILSKDGYEVLILNQIRITSPLLISFPPPKKKRKKKFVQKNVEKHFQKQNKRQKREIF
jgi:hypothetical protein